VHVSTDVVHFFNRNSIESFVSRDFAKGILLEGTDWYQSACSVDLMNGVAHAIEFGNWLVVEICCLERALAKSDTVRGSVCINNNLRMLSQEVCLNLFKNIFQVVPWRRQFTELVALLGAPKELARRETYLSNVVSANSNKIVTFNA
jgi:hypothetical protein